MPIYEYECTSCARVFEKLLRRAEDAPEDCKECGGAVKRLISAPAIQFKGTGWYVTDYAGKGKEAKTREKAEKEASTPAKSKKSSEPSGSKAGGDKGGSS